VAQVMQQQESRTQHRQTTNTFPASEESFLTSATLFTKLRPGNLKSARRSLHKIQVKQ